MTRLLISSVLLTFLAQPANAQFVGSWNFGSGWVQSEDVNRMNRIAQSADNQARRPALIAAPNRAIASASALTFQSSLAVRKRNFAQFVSKTRAQSPENADAMARLLTSTDVIGMMGSAIAPYGLRTNNVADAYALYWIAAWEASRGITDSGETRERIQAVKAQAANALLATPDFVNATPAQKQELAEAFLIQSALIQDTVNTYASDPAMLRKVSAAVAQGAKASGLDLKSMTLTEAGFKAVR